MTLFSLIAPVITAQAALPPGLNQPNQLIGGLNKTPIEKLNDTTDPISKIMNWVIGIFWIVAVGIVVWAAFMFLTAGGDEDKIKEAKMYLKYALIASAVALVSTGIDIFVSSVLSGTFG